jgi:hypothetical protein
MRTRDVVTYCISSTTPKAARPSCWCSSPSSNSLKHASLSAPLDSFIVRFSYASPGRSASRQIVAVSGEPR